MLEILKAILFGIVEGITEWLPVSSTGHMILLNEFLHLNVSAAFWEMFLVVIQLGAILAVVVLYWKKLIPFTLRDGFRWDKPTLSMWLKILISCVPAAIVGLLWDDELNRLFYNYQTVAVMLILFGVVFILLEQRNKGRIPTCESIGQLTYRAAIWIGLFQLIAAVFPGTSRSGATIVGALMIGVSRGVAAEYTFFLAIPVMLGASLLKLVQFGFGFTGAEAMLLASGMIAAFLVSLGAITFLIRFVKKHDFTAFGWYRIALGLFVVLYFSLAG